MRYLDMIAAILELHQKMIAPVSKEYGLTSTEMAILLFLANNPQYDTATEIVQKRHLAKSHVSTSIRSLEERKLLRREYKGNDHRTIHLILESGSEEIVKKGQAVQARYVDLLTRGIGNSEKNVLERVLGQIDANAMDALKEM